MSRAFFVVGHRMLYKVVLPVSPKFHYKTLYYLTKTVAPVMRF
jgi:hypothetical protein